LLRFVEELPQDNKDSGTNARAAAEAMCALLPRIYLIWEKNINNGYLNITDGIYHDLGKSLIVDLPSVYFDAAYFQSMHLCHVLYINS
jgi:hypothetical protein